MKNIFVILIFIAFIILGFFVSDFLFEDDDKLMIEDVVNEPEKYFGKDVELRGKAIEHSANEWIKLEQKKDVFIYIKHNMMDEYFRFGEKYQVQGVVKKGEVVFEDGEKFYIDAKEIIRNNSMEWI